MLLKIAVDLDFECEIDRQFVDFENTHSREEVKACLLSGFLMIKCGLTKFLDEKYKKDVEGAWVEKWEKQAQHVKGLEEQIASLRNFYESLYDEKYKRLYENKLVEKDEEVERSYKRKFEQMEDANNILHRRLKQVEEEVTCRVEQQVAAETRVLNEYKRQLEDLQQKCIRYENAYEKALQQNTQDVVNCFMENKVQDLQNTIGNLQSEISVLKSSNMYKGLVGEAKVRDILSNNFTNCSIIDTSKTGGLSDIHIITKEGHLYAIESKNKTSISQQDIEKSYQDIEGLKAEHGEGFKGYMFISHRTRNIPRKGHLCVEEVHGVHVIWFGAMDGDEHFESNLVLLMQLLMQSVANDNSGHCRSDLKSVIEFVRSKIELIQDNNRLCSSLKENANSMLMSINTLQANNKMLQEELLEVSGVSLNAMGSRDHKKGATAKKEGHVCAQCDQSFKRKCDLAQHLKGCK
jgi:hypothetical protein